MTRKTLLVAALLAALLASSLRPKRANALSTTDAVIISVGGVIAYVAVIYVGAKFAFPSEGQLLLPDERNRDLSTRYGRDRVQFGPACKTPDGQPALLCW